MYCSDRERNSSCEAYVHTGTYEKAKMSIKSSSQINSPYMQKPYK